jgi:hypothetical protein
VKRRFVRVPSSERDPEKSKDFSDKIMRRGSGPSPETLNLRHMIGGLTAGHRADLEKLVFLPIPSGAIPVGIGNENDQVS